MLPTGLRRGRLSGSGRGRLVLPKLLEGLRQKKARPLCLLHELGQHFIDLIEMTLDCDRCKSIHQINSGPRATISTTTAVISSQNRNR